MSAHLKRGVAVWILGFLTFLAGLNALNAVVIWADKGSDFAFKPYLIGDISGEMQAATYFWISVTTTFFILGLTAVAAYRRLPPDPKMLDMLARIEENMATNTATLQSVQLGLFQRLEQNKRSLETLSNSVDTNLDNLRREMRSMLKDQEKSIQELRSDLSSAIEAGLKNTRKVMASTTEKQAKATEKVHDELSELKRQGK